MTMQLINPILPPAEFDEVDFEFIHDPDGYDLRVSRAQSLPDPTALCCAVAHAAVEAFHGARPMQQLARLVSPRVYEQLTRRATAQAQLAVANGRSTARKRGVSAGGAKEPRPLTRIVRARVMRVSPVAAEASITVQDGHRVRAAALRVEEFRGRWRIEVLQIG